MQKFSRNSRISIITKILIENPSKIMSLNYFSEILNAAKSTISEDILVIREMFEAMEMGEIESIAGATGGVRVAATAGQGQSGNRGEGGEGAETGRRHSGRFPLKDGKVGDGESVVSRN